jgi:hypothetical protein
MGVVYRAMDLSLERPVALKLVAQRPGRFGRAGRGGGCDFFFRSRSS